MSDKNYETEEAGRNLYVICMGSESDKFMQVASITSSLAVVTAESCSYRNILIRGNTRAGVSSD